MTSVIRLLPRKKIERNVVPYRTLLGAVFSRRFRQAFVTTVYFIVVIGGLLAISFDCISFKRAISSLTFVSTVIIFTYKVSLSPEQAEYPSKAAAILGRLTRSSTYIFLCGYALSALVYNWSVLAPGMTIYSVEHAEPVNLPEGIPSSLALHKTDHWYVLNERYLYISSFVYFVAVLFAGYATVNESNVLKLDSAENGMKPLRRIKRRLLMKVKSPVVLWAGTALSWPFIYFLIVRNRATTAEMVSASNTVVTLSGFHWTYMFLPVLALPLCIVWYVTYEVFMAYLTLGPLYRGKPISDTARTDKNESLVNGLSQDPSSLSAFTAWHELLFIAEHDEPRRKSLYSDVDGERMIWELISFQFQKLLKTHEIALQHSNKPKKGKEADKKKQKQQAPHESSSTIRTTTSELLLGANKNDILRNETITPMEIRTQNPKLYNPESALEKKFANFAHSLERKSTTKAQVARSYLLKKGHIIEAELHRLFEAALATQLGAVFRKPMSRILASKLRNPQTTAFAIRSTARMITKSIHEDELGYVQSTIATVLTNLDAFAAILEKVISEAKAHLAKAPASHTESELKPALALLGEANSAFAEITEVFSPYFENLQVTNTVLNRTNRLSKGELVMTETAWII